MSAPVTFSMETVEQMVADARRQRLEPFPPESIAWLALIPRWSQRLADVVGLAAETESLDAFLQEAQAAGLVDRADHSGRHVFWMPSATRDEVLDQLTGGMGGSYDLLVQANALGERLRLPEADAELRALPDPVRRQGELLQRLRVDPSAKAYIVDSGEALAYLDARVAALLEAGQTGEALAWVRTGQAFAGLFGGRWEAAARLAERRLEIAYRRAQDERLLVAFLPRAEQIAAFEALVGRGRSEEVPVWALHYLGVGGVGKTMLLRYIAGVLAERHGYYTSRIDFDYISPHYPARKPGQLLLELADELRMYGDVQSHLLSFRNAVDALHETFSGLTAVPDPVAMLRTPDVEPSFEAVLSSFARLLSALDRPVVLILDTCEELAKYRGGGQRLPSVEATFYILEAVQARRPDVRVVFAGRRLLAQGGAGWAADDDHLAHRFLPDPRPYLALHPILGFTREEAERYLTEKKHLTVAPDLLEAMLEGSREITLGKIVQFDEDRSSRPGERRYNPFDLTLYADWLREEPELAQEVVASGDDDPYVERRIRARLKPSVEPLLPAVAILGRFDRRMLAPLLDDDAQTAEQQFRELAEQEWMDYQRDEALETTFLSVNPNLLARLRRFYQRDRARRATWDRIRTSLGPHVAALIRGDDRREVSLQRLGTDHLEAALRLLDAPEAARLWAKVELRIPSEAGWGAGTSWALAT